MLGIVFSFVSKFFRVKCLIEEVTYTVFVNKGKNDRNQQKFCK